MKYFVSFAYTGGYGNFTFDIDRQFNPTDIEPLQRHISEETKTNNVVILYWREFYETSNEKAFNEQEAKEEHTEQADTKADSQSSERRNE